MSFIAPQTGHFSPGFDPNTAPNERVAILREHNKRRMSFNCKLVLRSDYIREDGKCQVNIVASLNGQRTKLQTGEFVEPQHWDGKNQRVKPSYHHATEINFILEQHRARTNQIALDAKLRNEKLTVPILREEFLNADSRIDFIKYFEKTLAYKKKVTKPEGQRNLQCHSVTLGKIKQFRNAISFAELTYKLLEEYEAWCRNTRGNCDNTIWRDIKDIRIYVNHALRDGIRFKTPFEIYKLKKKETKRTFLDKNELSAIIQYYNSAQCDITHRFVLRYFLFACFTGLRKSDVFALTWDKVLTDRLIFYPQKVHDKPVLIPLRSMALAFLPARVESENVFEHRTEQYTNRVLKKVAAHLKIEKRITFHVARHTFATSLLREGVPIQVVSNLLGHRNIKTTMIYSHIEDREKDKAMDVLDKVFANALQ